MAFQAGCLISVVPWGEGLIASGDPSVQCMLWPLFSPPDTTETPTLVAEILLISIWEQLWLWDLVICFLWHTRAYFVYCKTHSCDLPVVMALLDVHLAPGNQIDMETENTTFLFVVTTNQQWWTLVIAKSLAFEHLAMGNLVASTTAVVNLLFLMTFFISNWQWLMGWVDIWKGGWQQGYHARRSHKSHSCLGWHQAVHSGIPIKMKLLQLRRIRKDILGDLYMW